MGVAADGSNKAFPSKDVDAFLDKPRAQIPVDIMGELSRYNTRHFVLAVDPAGGASCRSAGAERGAMGPVRGHERRRCGPLALKLLLEA